jgi:hypothetical protein
MLQAIRLSAPKDLIKQNKKRSASILSVKIGAKLQCLISHQAAVKQLS